MYNYNEFDPKECEYYGVASVNDLADGERIFVEIDDEYIVVFKIGDEYFAIADLCSHDDGPLGDGEIVDQVVVCPRHGARFNLRTGEALTFPAVIDIPAYPVRIIEGEIEVGLPKE